MQFNRIVMKPFLLLVMFLLPFAIKAQTTDSAKVIGIHPAVGKIISRDEKIKYHLFEEYKDSTFESAELFKCKDSTFLLSVKSIQGNELKSPISTKQLDDLYFKIDEVEKMQAKTADEYLQSSVAKEAEKKKKARDNSNFWIDFFTQLTIVTIETFITLALTN